MKSFVVILILAAVVGLGFKRWLDKSNPDVIAHPVYAEMHVDAKVGNRELNSVLFVKTVDQEDCNLRAEKGWSKLLSGCPTCTVSAAKCQDDLPARYQRLFDNVAIPSTYLAMERGSRYERDGRLVVYGLTHDEGLAMCEQIRGVVLEKYHGTGTCIAPSE